jgi:muconate cycloisomerase
MKITRIQTIPVRIPMRPERRMISALGQHPVSEYVIVRVETDAGIEGAGEATATPNWSGETVWGVKYIIDDLFAPALIGLDPHDVEAIDRVMDKLAVDNWFAKSAIEMACWDIQGKEAGKPVYELLGGPHRAREIPCRFSMGAYPPETAAERAAERVAAGFEMIKVKVGTGIEEDVQRVMAVREAIGPDKTLSIDANAAFTPEEAIDAFERMSGANVSLFEQPTHRGDFAGMARVRQAISAKVLADELVFDYHDAEECLLHEACDAITLYPGKEGGIRKACAIAAHIAEGNIGGCIGSNLELDVASAAMCHFILAAPNMLVDEFPGDLLGPSYHEFPIVKNPISIEGPIVTAPDGPGLGVEVDWDVIEECRIVRT